MAIRGLFINYWDSVNKRDMEEIQTWFYMTGDINSYFSLHYKYIWLHLAYRRWHKKSITWRYAEHSDVANNGVYAIVTASLLLNVHIIHSNTLHITLNSLIKYICSVNSLCTNATVMQFHSAIPLAVQYPQQCNTTHSAIPLTVHYHSQCNTPHSAIPLTVQYPS